MMVLSTSANKTLLSFNAPSRISQEESKVCCFAICGTNYSQARYSINVCPLLHIKIAIEYELEDRSKSVTSNEETLEKLQVCQTHCEVHYVCLYTF